FLVVGHRVYKHLRRDVGPLLFADPLQILKVAFLMSWLREGGSRPRFHGTWPHPLGPRCDLSRPVHLAEKQPQSIMFPPPCLTVGMVSYSAFFPLQTRQVELMLKSLI